MKSILFDIRIIIQLQLQLHRITILIFIFIFAIYIIHKLYLALLNNTCHINNPITIMTIININILLSIYYYFI